MYLARLANSPNCQYICTTATSVLYQKSAVEDEHLYFTLLKMPLETSVFCILTCMLQQNLMKKKYDFLVFLLPKTIPILL